MALYHMAKGPVNYTVMGSPTIVDGIASGFSTSNYIRISQRFDSSTTDYEFVIRATPHYGTREAAVMGGNQAFRIYFSTYKISVLIPDADWYEGITISNIFAQNTYYYIKLKRTGSEFALSYSTDGINYSTPVTKTIVPATGTNYIDYGYWGGDGWDPYNGSIDLNNTYIKVNVQPWFGNCPVEVKRHQIMGPVGYNLVGSPTIKDGIATGFTTTSYLMTNSQFNFSQATDYEFVTRATPHAVSGRNAAIVGTHGSGMVIYFKQNAIECYPGNNTLIVVRSAFDVSSFYYIRLTRKGNVYTLDYSLDGINYTGANSVTSQQHLSSSLFLRFGYYSSDGWDPLDGKIDFNHTYIKANNELWFYQPQETKYIIRNGKLVWADSRLALSGPVNYTVVGNPTITDNIITQANNSNYVNISSADIPYTQYWEFVTYVQLGVLTHSAYGISNVNNANGKARWQIGTNGTRLRFIAAYDNGWAVDITCPTNFSANDWIYIKLNFTAATRTFTLYSSVDGVNWTNEATASPQVYEDGTGNILRLMNDSHLYPAFLSMDLNKTYIKTDESLWFYGKNYATSNIAPVPTGFTYGTITTPSIGYVDMRTQTFTAAPQGATIGRDE